MLSVFLVKCFEISQKKHFVFNLFFCTVDFPCNKSLVIPILYGCLCKQVNPGNKILQVENTQIWQFFVVVF